MRKWLKFIVPGICIFVVAITFFMLFDMQNKIEKEKYGVENIDSSDETNTIQNLVNTNVSDIENKNEVNNIIEEEHVVDEEEDKFSKTKQEKAIDLVKEYWGEDSTVYFTNEGINSNGEYMVAVRKKTSTTVEDYFKVDIEKETVEIDY